MQTLRVSVRRLAEPTPENSSLGFSGAKILSMSPNVVKQLNNTN